MVATRYREMWWEASHSLGLLLFDAVAALLVLDSCNRKFVVLRIESVVATGAGSLLDIYIVQLKHSSLFSNEWLLNNTTLVSELRRSASIASMATVQCVA
jgi:hypothetical protein